MVFAGNVALESMGFETFGFGFGREDVWEPEEDLLGAGGHLARRRALQRRPRARRPARRRADGPDLREPRGPERQPRPAGRGARHPRDLPPHGDERRGDGRAHRRRPHLRQDPRRRRSAEYVGREPEGCPVEEQGLGWRNTYGTGKGEDTITSGLEGAWTPTPITWDNSFFETLFGYEWELTESPAGAKQWRPKDGARSGRRARRARPVGAARPDDADDRPRAAVRPGLRADLAALPRAPRRARRRVRPGLVQAAAPRHGAGVALPRPVGARGAAAGRTRSRPSTTTLVGDDDIAALKATILASGLSVSQLVAHRVGVGGDLPRHRQARRRQRRADPPRAAEGLGGQRARRAGDGAADPRADPAGLQRRADRREAGLARRPDRARRLRGGRAGGEGRRPRRHRPVHAGAHRRLPGADRRRVVRGARADRRRVPQLPPDRRQACRPRRCCSTGPTC